MTTLTSIAHPGESRAPTHEAAENLANEAGKKMNVQTVQRAGIVDRLPAMHFSSRLWDFPHLENLDRQ